MDKGWLMKSGAQGAAAEAAGTRPAAPKFTTAVAVATAGLLVGLCTLAGNGNGISQPAVQSAVDQKVPRLAPRHEAMDFDMAVTLVNERSYRQSGAIEIVALTASDFGGFGQSLVSHQLTSDAGKAVSAPRTGELKNRLAKGELSTEQITIKQSLKDGYYKVRSIGVGADAASSTVAQVESYFLVQKGELYEVDANQWFENSLANQANGG